MYRHRHDLFLLLGPMCQTLEPLGFAGAARQFLDDLLRQAGRRSGPGVGQQVDEEFVAGGDGIDRHFARQPDADGAAVGIAPRGADIFRRLCRQAVDRDEDRLVEGDRQPDLDDEKLERMYRDLNPDA